jgi:exonuclease VII small subunit
MEKGKTYGEAISRLEEIVGALERGGKGLEENPSVIRRGRDSVKPMSRRLESRRRKVE